MLDYHDLLLIVLEMINDFNSRHGKNPLNVAWAAIVETAKL